ncbi:DUF2538 family protein [Macrococcus animalis]|uniref:DUF2538 family protein n=1 Tax=Macrococcus animalis TaxID=3395467 RepID=UPI0039BECC5C
MTTRKTYEKYEHINNMFDKMHDMIISPRDVSHLRKHFFYLNEYHQQNYEALLIYYTDADKNPLTDGACYILAIPEIFNNINVFDYEVPLDFVFDGEKLSHTFTNLNVFYQYLIAAVLEVSDIQIFTPSGYSMGMNHWDLAQMQLFWQYTAIIKMHN